MARVRRWFATATAALSLALMPASCVAVPDDAADSVAGSAELSGRTSLALSTGTIKWVNGSYGGACLARSGSWSVRVSGTEAMTFPALSVVRNNAACQLTLTAFAADSTYTAAPSLTMTTSYQSTPAAFSSGGAIAFYGNAGLDTTTFASNFVVSILASADSTSATGAVTATVVATSAHSCGLTSDNQLYCWGAAANGRLGNGSTSPDQTAGVLVDVSSIPGSKKFVRVAAGSNHTCALSAEGNAYCWGSETNGRLGNGSTSSNQTKPVLVDTSSIAGSKAFIEITAGDAHTCALTSDSVPYCWGAGSNGRLGNAATTDQVRPVAVNTAGISGSRAFIQISAGASHTCGVAVDGVPYCWGAGSNGRLGDGASTDRTTPAAVTVSAIASSRSFLSARAGGEHSCGLASDGKAFCWGKGNLGQLGNAANSDQTAPAAVSTTGIAASKSFIALSVNFSSSCGVMGDRKVYCWGSGASGELGNAATSNQSSPVLVDTSGMAGAKDIVALTAGSSHTCASSSDGVPFCWGAAANGRLGNGAAAPNQSKPVAVNTSALSAVKAFRQITSGFDHGCGLTTDGRPYCWGMSLNGRLGNATTTPDQAAPVAVDTSGIAGSKTFIQISAGDIHTCGLASDGVPYCWGDGSNGRLGDGTNVDKSVPTPVDTSAITGSRTFTQLLAGGTFSCGLASDGKAYCWGRNVNGQLGNNGTSSSYVPVSVLTSGMTGSTTFSRLSAGKYHTCGIASDGKLYCWGYALYGQLGNGATTDVKTPFPVTVAGITSQTTFTRVAPGGFHTCAIASDAKLFCWGYNQNREVGDNSLTQRDTPVAVDTAGLSGNLDFVGISTGNRSSCALTAAAIAYCWGMGTSGQLGNGANTTGQGTPALVSTTPLSSDKKMISVVAGNTYACGLNGDRKLYCWGAAANGRLGNGTTSPNTNVPSAVTTPP